MKVSPLAVMAAAVMFSGCASSERAFRMSGGVFDEYSAPKSTRIRSEKYQKKSRELETFKRSGKEALDFNKTLVNVWPFFFASGEYTSILWPMIDYDPYGMAIRPFYNHEGDEYSILFPLSGWNPVNKDGWVLNTFWGKNEFTFFPLAHYGKSDNSMNFWCTPFVIINRQNYTPSVYNTKMQSKFWEIMLAYSSYEKRKDKSAVPWLNNRWNDGTKRELAYRFGKTGEKVPQSEKEYRELQQATLKKLPEYEVKKWGFFPLFHVAETPSFSSFNLIGPLYEYRNGKDGAFYSALLGPLLGEYEVENFSDSPLINNKKQEKTFSSAALLLSQFKKTTRYEETREVKTIRRIRELSFNDNFGMVLPEAKKEFASINKEQKIPDTVTDGNTLRLFVDDYAKERDFPVYHEYEGGIFPFYFYKKLKEKEEWFSLVLLTGSETFGGHYEFNSFPLMTFIKRTPAKDTTTVATPAVWYSKQERLTRWNKEVFDRNTYFVKERDMVEVADDYAACGLYFHGINSFQIAKAGVDVKALNTLRKNIWLLSVKQNSIDMTQQKLAKQDERIAAWQTRNKIEYYRKLIAIEEQRIAKGKAQKEIDKYNQLLKETKACAGKIGYTLPEKITANTVKCQQMIEDMLQKYTELRQVEDWGSGLFYRKEQFGNGDCNWRIFLGLAGGKKEGDKEDTHVLHLLYRYRQEGKKSEKLIFPFISIQKDGEDSRSSFLWRVWQRTRKAGKTSGYFLFIPY